MDEKRVVVVEEKEELGLFLWDCVKKEYDIFCGVEGVDGLRIVKKEDIDMVIRDIMMGNMDGIEVWDGIKSEMKI